jgi:hypothetical protein
MQFGIVFPNHLHIGRGPEVTRMRWDRVREEKKILTHGSERISDGSTLEPDQIDRYPRDETDRRRTPKPRTPQKPTRSPNAGRETAPKKRQPIPPELPKDPILLIRALESWSIRDSNLGSCASDRLTEMQRTLSALNARIEGELNRRRPRRR